VANDPDAEFLEAHIFDEDNVKDRPFEWIKEYYRRRMLLKKTGSPAQLTFKLIINSAYGIVAQRQGWDREKKTPPPTHQLEWAGWITSACRAAVYRVARELGTNLISIDTDGITSLRPFTGLTESDNLGDWEMSKYDDGVFWQSGIYALKHPLECTCKIQPCPKAGKWSGGQMKTRGIARGKYKAEDLIERCTTLEPLKSTRRVFIGYAQALQGRREELNTWIDIPGIYVFGGGSKRGHIAACSNACRQLSPGMHALTEQVKFGGIPESEPHPLPWIGSTEWQDDMDLIKRYGEEYWDLIPDAE
jgi:hypothetical protein